MNVDVIVAGAGIWGLYAGPANCGIGAKGPCSGEAFCCWRERSLRSRS